MKVFFVSRGYPSEKYKMYGIFERDQAEALAKMGLEVVFLSVDLRSIRRQRKFGDGYFEKNGVKVYSIDWPVGAVPDSLLYKIGERALERVYKRAVRIEGKPDILHAYFTDYAYMAARLKDKLGYKLVITEPSSKVNQDSISEELFETASYAYSKADAVITPSPDFQKTMEKSFGQDSKVISILPDMGVFNYKADKDDEIFKIVSTGSLKPKKGAADLIKGFHQAYREDPNTQLTIFGDGPEREKLEGLIKDLSLNDRVFLRGLVDRKEIAEEYKNSHLFALYSHSETFGLSYLEALAAGLPIIVPTCGGPEHLVKENNGLLIELFDEDALVKALRYMKENIGNYDGREISLEAKEEYSEANITGKVIDVYKEVLGLD